MADRSLHLFLARTQGDQPWPDLEPIAFERAAAVATRHVH
jgi:hypothetical protein